MKWRMTFRHLCLLKIIRPMVTVVIVSVGEFVMFLFASRQVIYSFWWSLCLNYFILLSSSSFVVLNCRYSYTHLLTIFYFSFVYVFSHSSYASPSLSLSIPLLPSHFFLIDTKTACRVRWYLRCALSHFVCSVLGGSVSLCVLLIFLPLTVYVCVYVYARFALSLSAIDSLQTHTHTHTSRARLRTHIETMMGREAHRGSGRKNERVKQTRESKRRSPLILMHKMIVMLFASMIYNGWGASTFSHFVPSRWREWWRPVEKHFYAVTEIWLFFLLHLSFTNRMLLFFFFFFLLLFSIQ